jgi:hypothetical protein
MNSFLFPTAVSEVSFYYLFVSFEKFKLFFFCLSENLINLNYLIVKEDTLLDMVSSMKDDVALVHQMPFVCDRKGFPSVLEKVIFISLCFQLDMSRA